MSKIQRTPQCFVSLHYGDPGTEGWNELKEPGYERQEVEFVIVGPMRDDGLTSKMANKNIVSFHPPNRSIAWGYVGTTGYWDAESGGNYLGQFSIAFDAITLDAGQGLAFGVGDLGWTRLLPDD